MNAQSEPDFDRLAEICTEIEAMKAAGTWSREAFEKALADGEKALNGWGEGLECILIHADDTSWINDATTA